MLLASGDSHPGDNVRLWEVETGQEKKVLRGNASAGSIAFSPDGALLAIADENNSVYLWEIETGKQLRALAQGQLASPGELAFSPDGTMLAIADMIAVQLWEVETGTRLQELTPDGGADLVVFSSKGSLLATDACSEKDDRSRCVAGEVWLWDLETRQVTQVFQGHTGSVMSIALSPDGDFVVSGGYHDHDIHVWDVETGQQAYMLEAHAGAVKSLAFSPDGTMFASGSYDDTVRVWSVQEGRELHLLEGYTSSIQGILMIQSGFGIRLRGKR
jgi:WD40 repeat protein